MTIPAVKLQRGRRGTDAASAWVRALRIRLLVPAGDGKDKIVNTGIPAKDVKHLLLTIAQYVDHDGCCFPSFQTLADDTEMSWDSIKRRLADAEYLRLIARFRRWRDPNGVLNAEGRGRETSGEIRLLFDTSQEEIDELLRARASGEEPVDDAVPQDDAEAAGCANSPPQAEDLGCAGVPTPGAQYSPPLKNPSLEPKEDSPPTPLRGVVDGDAGQDSEVKEADEAEQRWQEFKTAFEADKEPIGKPSLARQLLVALTPAEAKRVTTAARGLVAWRSKQKKPPSKLAAQSFIREIDGWDSWAQHAPPEISPPTWIAENSIEHKALRVLFMVTGEAMPQLRFDIEKGQHGYLRKLAVPQDLCGLAVFIDKPIDEWGTVEKTNTMATARPFYAWAERIEKWTGHRPEPQRINTGGEHPFTHNGVTTMIKDFVLGLRVPCLYPPRKDGTLSPDTGPDPPKESAA